MMLFWYFVKNLYAYTEFLNSGIGLGNFGFNSSEIFDRINLKHSYESCCSWGVNYFLQTFIIELTLYSSPDYIVAHALTIL